MTQPSSLEISAVVAEASKRLAELGALLDCKPASIEGVNRVIVHLYSQVERYRAIAGCRPEVIAFALEMERRLQEKDQDRVASWKHKSARALSVDLCSKAMALDSACIKLRPEPGGQQLLAKHAVDVANFAMFIADVAGALTDDQIVNAGRARAALAREQGDTRATLDEALNMGDGVYRP